MNFFPHHLSYFTQNDIAQTEFGPWTVKDDSGDSMSVDQWIEKDINARVDVYLENGSSQETRDQ